MDAHADAHSHTLVNYKTLENKINDILNTLKTKDQQIRLSTNELNKITTQLSKLDLGKTTSQTSTKFVLAKPRK